MLDYEHQSGKPITGW